MNTYRNHWSWYMGVSAYWFATSFKWFILLLVVLPGQIEKIVPGGEKSQTWGMVFAIGAGWAIIGPSLFGFLSDRLGLRRRAPYIAVGAAMTAGALVLLMGANTIPMIVIGYLLLQLSDDVGTGPYAALIPDLVPEEHRGIASGWMGLASNAGQIAIGVLALVLGDVGKIYLAIAVVNILCAVWVILAIRPYEKNLPALAPEDRPKATVREFFAGWIEPWKSRDFFWVWFTRFLNAFGFYLVVNYLRFFLSDSYDRLVFFGIEFKDSAMQPDAGMATNVLALTISLMGIFGAIWAGRRADRVGRKRTIYQSGVLMAGALFPAIFVRDYTQLWLFATLFGVGYGMYLSADWALVSDVLPNKEASGQAMGVWTMSNSVVQIFTGVMGAAIAAGNQLGRGVGYTIAFVAATFLFLLSTVLVRQVKGST